MLSLFDMGGSSLGQTKTVYKEVSLVSRQCLTTRKAKMIFPSHLVEVTGEGLLNCMVQNIPTSNVILIINYLFNLLQLLIRVAVMRNCHCQSTSGCNQESSCKFAWTLYCLNPYEHIDAAVDIVASGIKINMYLEVGTTQFYHLVWACKQVLNKCWVLMVT